MNRAVIFCGGEMDTDSVWEPGMAADSLILCADGGLRHAVRLGVTPHAVIGDRDSAPGPWPREAIQRVYPPEKDVTDTNLCLDYAIDQGCREALILGGLGGRLDHEFSHYSLLLYGLRRGVRVRLVNGQNEIWMADRPFTLRPGPKKYVSFFPFGGPVEGFTIEGLKYPAADMELDCGLVQASSNEFAGPGPARVSFRRGTLLVMLCQDDWRAQAPANAECKMQNAE